MTIDDETVSDAREAAEPPFRDVFFTSTDGLKLHARDYGPRGLKSTPVLCLPGLTRGVRDFHQLAMRLAHDSKRRRRVVVAEFRGRGESQYDKDVTNYTPKREAQDTLDLMAVVGLEHAVVIGTSRGGIVTMVMSAMRPTVLKAFVLNDIGPKIEGIGLLRISGQLTRSPVPRSWEEASESLRQMHGEVFTGLSDDDWMRFAREVFRDQDGKPARDYDPKIAKTLDPEAISSGETPDLWPVFEGLTGVSGLVIRGEHSDLLSASTVTEMQKRHRKLSALTVPGRGHVPFLTEPEATRGIDSLLSRIDSA